jgi:cytochrome c6
MQAGATLSLADMQRNGILDVDQVYKVVYSGKGKMYGFGQGCAPKGKCTFGLRLSDEEVSDVATFVWTKANQGW